MKCYVMYNSILNRLTLPISNFKLKEFVKQKGYTSEYVFDDYESALYFRNNTTVEKMELKYNLKEGF